VEVTTHAGDRQRIDVFVRVLPIGRAAVLDVGPFTLDLG
jgi:hypothetical protein